MSWMDRLSPRDVVGFQRLDRERREREQATLMRVETERVAALRLQQGVIFRRIISPDACVRLQGYQEHLALLANIYRTTIRHHAKDSAYANWKTQSYMAPPFIDEESCALGYHEQAHVVELLDSGGCPNDGVHHRRDASVREWWNCIGCETAATARALSWAPFTRSMFDRLACGLQSYRLMTPGSQRSIERLDRLAGTITFYQHQSRWRRWFDRMADVERWRTESQRGTMMRNPQFEYADESERNDLIVKTARTVAASFEAGQRCVKCRGPASVRRGDGAYYCQQDADIMAQRAQRARMRETTSSLTAAK